MSRDDLTANEVHVLNLAAFVDNEQPKEEVPLTTSESLRRRYTWHLVDVAIDPAQRSTARQAIEMLGTDRMEDIALRRRRDEELWGRR